MTAPPRQDGADDGQNQIPGDNEDAPRHEHGPYLGPWGEDARPGEGREGDGKKNGVGDGARATSKTNDEGTGDT
jgi:hypothetical protein